MAQADAEALIRDHGAEAYREARERERDDIRSPSRRVSSFRGCRLLNLSPTLLVLDASSASPSAVRVRAIRKGEPVMDKMKEVKGAGKETVGKAIGDAKTPIAGKTDKAVGKIQNAVGGLKDAAKKP